MNEAPTQIGSYSMSAKQAGSTIESRQHEIRKFVKEERLDAALTLCHEVLQLDEANSECLFLKAFVLYKQGRSTASEEVLAQAIEINSFSPDYYALLAALKYREKAYEEAAFFADNGLKIRKEHKACLKLRVLALVRLFRLQEAHDSLQVGINTESTKEDDHLEGLVYTTEDPEELFEVALMVDPFKSKTRFQVFSDLKSRQEGAAKLPGIISTKAYQFIGGCCLIVGLIFAVFYFIREQAGYQYFSLLLFSFILIMMDVKSLSVSTNFPAFFPEVYRDFLQKKDIKLAVKGVCLLLTFITSFVIWHFFKSYTALVISIIFSVYFSQIHQKFSSGDLSAAFSLPKSRAKRREKRKAQHMTLPLEQASYGQLYQVLRSSGITSFIGSVASKVLKYGSIVLLFYTVLFLCLKSSGLVQDNAYFIVPAAGIFFLLQLMVMSPILLDLPIFFKANTRRFIPKMRKKKSFLMLAFELLFLATLSFWLIAGNLYGFWGGVLVLGLMIKLLFVSKKEKEELDRLPKQELIDYLQHQVQQPKE